MEFVQTERNDKGVVVNVRLNARLRALQAEVSRLQKLERTAAERLGTIDRERQLSDENPSMGLAQRAEWETRRTQLKAEYDATDVAQQTAQNQLKAAQLEYSEWLEHFGQWQYQIKQLQRELPNALDGDTPSFVTTNLGEAPRRSKTEIENEMIAVLGKLANFSGDDLWQREYEQLEKKIADSRPYVFLKNRYVRLGSGELVTEAEFQERAVEFGSVVVSRGATSSPYQPGVPIPREEAMRLGLT